MDMAYAYWGSLPVPFARVKPGKLVVQSEAVCLRGDSLSGFTRTGGQGLDDKVWRLTNLSPKANTNLPFP
jgi:hypothetical protein